MTQKFINDFADKLKKVGALHAIGETWISIDSTIPAGGVPYLGQLVNRSVWADLFAWATAQGKVKTESEWQTYASANGGNCPFYSDGDGSTTFRMPCVKSYLKGADTLLDAGGYTAEGLPNITGTGYDGVGSADISALSASTSGALGCEFVPGARRVAAYTGAPQGTDTGSVSFDASKSNPTYGNSDHVTPETHSILIGVYAVGVVANVGSADAAKFLNGLANLEASVERVNSSGSDYIKFESGIAIFWACDIIPSGQLNKTITFPFAFSYEPSVTASYTDVNNITEPNLTTVHATTTSVTFANCNTYGGTNIGYVWDRYMYVQAIGRWK